MRCYAPSVSTIAALLFAGYLALRHTAGHALAATSLVTTIVIVLGVAGLAVGAMVVSAATIRRRRAAAGACHTCSHPCRQEPDLSVHVVRAQEATPEWPHRPLTRAPLPVIVIPAQLPELERPERPVRERELAR